MKRLPLALIFVLALAPQAFAATATLKWTNPTQRTDGSTITGALTTTIFDTYTPAGSTSAGVPINLGVGTTGFVTGQLQPGTHAFQIINCEASTLVVAGACSAYSNILTITVLNPPKAIIDLVDDLTGGP